MAPIVKTLQRAYPRQDTSGDTSEDVSEDALENASVQG
jgi:hypothetical protein